MKITARELAYEILLDFENSHQRLDDLYTRHLSNKTISDKEKKFLYNLTSGVIRFLNQLDWKSSGLYNGDYRKSDPEFRIILRLAIFEIDQLDFIPPHATVNEYVNLAKKRLKKYQPPVINGILRTYLRKKGSFNPAKKFKFPETQISVESAMPEWLVRRWIDSWGEEETRKLCKAFLQRPWFDLRINRTKISVEEFTAFLKNESVSYQTSSVFPEILRVSDVQKINRLGLFKNGYCSIQDESARIITDLLNVQPEDCILDACTAPGGKFTSILEQEIQPDFLVGFDLNQNRLNIVAENCRRLNLEKYNLVCADAFQPPFRSMFNKILIDAPCSGLGTLNKHPDIKWRRSEEEINQFYELQFGIVKNMANLVVKNGILIYSTCTIDRCENEMVVQAFLKESDDRFVINALPQHLEKFHTSEGFIRTFPHLHEMDGSFAAILKRVK